MNTINMSLKTARGICSAIMYSDEQVMSSDIPVYVPDANNESSFNVNRKLNEEMTTFAYTLLNKFRNQIHVTVLPECISVNREQEYVMTAQHAYMFGLPNNKVTVTREDDDVVELIYHR